MQYINICAPIPEIIDVIHKHQIPVALVHKVFEMTEEQIKWNSIPQNQLKENGHPMSDECGYRFFPDKDK